MKSILTAVLISLSTIILSGCATGLGGGTYSRDQARQEQTVRTGIVESVREVQIEGTRSMVGAVAGGVAGGIGGSYMGDGTLGALGAVLGAVGGGMLGQAAEEGVTRRKGVEITIKLDNGSLVAITQEVEENETFKPGERVRILSGGGASRVTH